MRVPPSTVSGGTFHGDFTIFEGGEVDDIQIFDCRASLAQSYPGHINFV
ncbi:hypothetical protein EDF56_107114 [Novosphingobium sp. PhB165]|nr:hypothetical protein EDF56_107114 [Novosphingobium sp. PhB165]